MTSLLPACRMPLPFRSFLPRRLHCPGRAWRHWPGLRASLRGLGPSPTLHAHVQCHWGHRCANWCLNQPEQCNGALAADLQQQQQGLGLGTATFPYSCM